MPQSGADGHSKKKIVDFMVNLRYEMFREFLLIRCSRSSRGYGVNDLRFDLEVDTYLLEQLAYDESTVHHE